MSFFKAKQVIGFLSVAEIGIACLAMHFILRHGLPVGGTVEEQALFIANNATLWHLSWFTWNVAAFLLGLFCCFLYTYTNKTALQRVGLACVLFGIIPDMWAEYLLSFALHEIALTGDLAHFQAVQAKAMKLTGLYANGFYNIGGLILTLSLMQMKQIDSRIHLFGAVAWVLGIGLSIAVALEQMLASEVFTAVAMTISLGYMALISWKLFGESPNN